MTPTASAAAAISSVFVFICVVLVFYVYRVWLNSRKYPVTSQILFRLILNNFSGRAIYVFSLFKGVYVVAPLNWTAGDTRLSQKYSCHQPEKHQDFPFGP